MKENGIWVHENTNLKYIWLKKIEQRGGGAVLLDHGALAGSDKGAFPALLGFVCGEEAVIVGPSGRGTREGGHLIICKRSQPGSRKGFSQWLWH